MGKQNRPFKVTDPDTGNEYILWDSRSCAVGIYCFVKDRAGNWYVLANKRGEGCPDYQGYWCCPCGYLDWDEDEYMAACRETFEECGISVNYNNVINYDCSADPSLNRENVAFRLYTVLPLNMEYYRDAANTEHMEENEVTDIKFVKITDVDNYQWAFGHGTNIKQIFNTRINISWWKKIILNLYNKYLYAK